MNVISIAYKSLLTRYESSHGYARHISRALLELFNGILAKLVDFDIEIPIHGRPLHLPLSHRLPIYCAAHPVYDELPIRVSNFLRAKYGYLTLIDVGANVGDTISACSVGETDKFLAIEPNPHFSRYIRKNCRNCATLYLLDVYCTSSNGYSEFTVDESMGTATIRQADGGRLLRRMTLDKILDENRAFDDFNFLKIDTDGHDFQVIEGARKSLVRNSPAILFESEPFENERYVEEFIGTMHSLAQAGYANAIVYDNLGYIFGMMDLTHARDFRFSLVYQLTSEFDYFDILVLRQEDLSAFASSEIAYFIGRMPNEKLRSTAQTAASL